MAFLHAMGVPGKDPLAPLTVSDARLEDLLGRNQVGKEAIADQVGSDLLTRTALQALATGVTVVARQGPTILKTPLRVVRSGSLVSWYLAQLTSDRSPLTAMVVGLAVGLGLAGAAADLFTTNGIGALGLVCWLLLLGVTLVGLMRSPFFTLPVLALGVLPGLSWRLGSRAPDWWSGPWVHAPRWVAVTGFVAAFASIAMVRQFSWLNRQIGAVRTERQRLTELPARRTVRHRALAVSGAMAALLVANAVLGWLGGSLLGASATGLAIRTAAALVVVVVLVRAVDRESTSTGQFDAAGVSSPLVRRVVAGLVAAAALAGPLFVDDGGRLVAAIGAAALTEVMFRGVLFGFAMRTGQRWVPWLTVSLAFGLWHLPSALAFANDHADWTTGYRIVACAGAVLGLAFGSRFVLEPLRLRTRSIIGPLLVHVAAVTAALVAGFPHV